MGKNKNKFFMFLIIFIILITFIGVVSANENNTYSLNIENIDTNDIELDKEVESNTNEETIEVQEDNDSNDILKTNLDENDELGYFNYKKSTKITGYDINKNIDLSSRTTSLPSVTVYVTDYSQRVPEGQVEFEVNGQKYLSKVGGLYTKGTGEATLSGDKIFKNFGTYIIKAKYLGTSNYYESSTITLKYTIYGKTTIKVDDITVNNGQYVIIKPTITPTFNTKYYAGNITLNINGVRYTLNSNNPSLKLNLKTGTYSCTAEYGTNPYYIKSTDTFKITVVEEPLIVAQDYYINILGKENILNIYVVDSNGDPINGGKIYLNEIAASVKDGYAQFNLNPQDIAFDYYSVEYIPNVKHYKEVCIKDAFPIATISTTKLTINSLNTIAGTAIKNVKYTITDGLNRKISPSGYFLINGKKYKSLKEFKTPKKAGTYKYTVKFVPDLILYGNSTATLKIVNKLKTTVKVKSVSGYENKKVKLTAIIKDNLGKKVKKGTVTFKIRGKTYKAKVKNGKAVKTIKIPKPGSRAIYYYYHYKNGKEIQTAEYEPETYKCSVVYKGNNKYMKSSSKFKVTSKKKSKSKRYHTPYNPPTKSTSKKTTKKTTTKKTTKKKTTTKKTTTSYGYYPTYHKPIPKLDVNLFKKQPQFDTSISLKDIKIIT